MATPDTSLGRDLPSSTITHFRGPNREDRLAAGQNLIGRVLLGHEDEVLRGFGYADEQRPYVAEILKAVGHSHEGGTEQDGWRYPVLPDPRRIKGFVELDSPLPGVVGAVAHIGKEPSRLENAALAPILAESGGSEVAWIYVVDSSFWNPNKLVKALTAGVKQPKLGIRSKDHKFGWLLQAPRAFGAMGLYSSRMEDSKTMAVDLDVPGRPRIDRRYQFFSEVPGIAIAVGRMVDNPSGAK